METEREEMAEERTIRIQFDLKESEYKEGEKYVGSYKFRHVFGLNAWRAMINKRTGQDKEAARRKRFEDKEYLRGLMREIGEEERR